MMLGPADDTCWASLFDFALIYGMHADEQVNWINEALLVVVSARFHK